MAFADPQVLTIATVATNLPKIASLPTASKFATPDGTRTLSTSQQNTGKKSRALARLDTSKISTDVFDVKVKLDFGLYLVSQKPTVGFTEAELLAEWTMFRSWLEANSNANLKKLFGGES